MTEDAFVDTKVREFAIKHDFDPGVSQELFFKYDVDFSSDGADKTSLDTLARAADKEVETASAVTQENTVIAIH